MAWLTCFGSLLLGMSPSLAAFIGAAAPNSQLLFATLFASFFYLTSSLIPVLIWVVVYPLRDSVLFHFGFWVVCQEFFRMLFFGLFDTVRTKLRRSSPALAPASNAKTDLALALSQGIAFAVMHAMMSFVTEVVECFKYQYGDAIAPNCQAVPFITLDAAHVFLFSICHISWSLIMASGLLSNSVWTFWFVLVTHLAATIATLDNEVISSCCFCSLIMLSVITVAVVSCAYYLLHKYLTGRSTYREDTTTAVPPPMEVVEQQQPDAVPAEDK